MYGNCEKGKLGFGVIRAECMYAKFSSYTIICVLASGDVKYWKSFNLFIGSE
jgi:hypothetical protein